VIGREGTTEQVRRRRRKGKEEKKAKVKVCGNSRIVLNKSETIMTKSERRRAKRRAKV
jgi:hypothetical protein